MRVIGAISLAGMLVVASGWSPAGATTAIYYSAHENTYGWCAGYSEGRAESCAKKNCKNQGGTECELALECKDGWGAIALAEDPATGVGMSCGMPNPSLARGSALLNCAAEANTLCWTDYAFDGNGDAFDNEDNGAFDQIWYAQALLEIRGLGVAETLGKIGPETREAISTFQKLLARKPTGVLDDEIVERLLDAVTGRQRFVQIMKRDVLSGQPEALRDLVHAQASIPVPPEIFSVEMAKWDENHRLIALATLLSASGSQCTLPAERATAQDDDPSLGAWQVVCAERTYKLFLSEDGSRTIVTEGNTSSGKKSRSETKAR
jgi:hypothetical protein